MAADLTAIRNKIRRLTRTPSANMLSNVDLDEYVNTFILYDLPSHLKLFSLRVNYTWFTRPNIAEYRLGTTDMLDNYENRGIRLTDTLNQITTVYRPLYIGGDEMFFTQSQQEFYGIYPKTESLIRVGSGDAIITNFTGTLTGPPVLGGTVNFSSVDANNVAIQGSDSAQTGIIAGDGVGFDFTGTINYLTGAFNITATVAPAADVDISAEYFSYVAAKPQALLFFDNTFYLRPVPDKSYRVQMEVALQPTALLNAANTPELDLWWQYIAYGAAKKIFEDRTDMNSVAEIMPEFKKQETLVNRRTVDINTKERSSTIYTQQTQLTSFPYGGQFGNFR